MITPGAIIVMLSIVSFLLARQKLEDNFKVIVKLAIVFELFVQIGYFAKLGNSTYITYSTVISVVALFLAIALLPHYRIKSNDLMWFCALVSVVTFGLLLLIVMRPTGVYLTALNKVTWDDYLKALVEKAPLFFSETANGVQYFKLMVVLVVVLTIKTIYTKSDYESLLEFVAIVSKVIILFVFAELLFKYFLNSSALNDLANSIFGISKNTYVGIVSRGSFVMLLGLTKEASHLVYCLMLGIIFISVSKTRGKLFWIALSLILMVFSGGLSFMYCIATLMLLLLLKCIAAGDEDKRAKALIGVIIVAICVTFTVSFVPYFSQRIAYLNRSITFVMNGASNPGWVSSSDARLISVAETIKLAIMRPLFGYGIGSLTLSHGVTANIIASIGLLGFASWALFLFSPAMHVGRRSALLYFCAVIVYLGSNLVNSQGYGDLFHIGSILMAYSLFKFCAVDEMHVRRRLLCHATV